MTSIRRFALTIATTLAIALAVSPAVAGDSAPARPNKAAFAAKRNKFPMEAKRFQKLLNKRLERVRAKLDRALIKRGVPRAVAKRIKAELNKNASRLVRAAQKATLDGIVTNWPGA